MDLESILTPDKSTENSGKLNSLLISPACQSGLLFRSCLPDLRYDLSMRHITTLLFDLGGVLIELGDLHEMMATSPISPEAIWRGWIRSPAVRAFESGACNEAEFATNMIAEFDLTLDENEFLELFCRWPKRTFPGAELLLEQLSDDFALACLSNTNITHFEFFLSQQPIVASFERCFFSHETGLLKPEREAFENVLDQLALSPDQVLFFDDNQVNVDAASSMGMAAERVDGPGAVRRTLIQGGLLQDTR